MALLFAAAFPSSAQVAGSGKITYNISMSANASGYAVLNWFATSATGAYCTGAFDWVGVFPSASQALASPNSYFLGGSAGWQWAKLSPPFTTNVQLLSGYVAAYVIKNEAGQYVTMAVTDPWP